MYDADNEAGIIGKWTMMYDEGMIVDLDDGTSMFVFFSYSIWNGLSVTDCSKTLIGWYRDTYSTKMGCFYAE